MPLTRSEANLVKLLEDLFAKEYSNIDKNLKDEIIQGILKLTQAEKGQQRVLDPKNLKDAQTKNLIGLLVETILAEKSGKEVKPGLAKSLIRLIFMSPAERQKDPAKQKEMRELLESIVADKQQAPGLRTRAENILKKTPRPTPNGKSQAQDEGLTAAEVYLSELQGGINTKVQGGVAIPVQQGVGNASGFVLSQESTGGVHSQLQNITDSTEEAPHPGKTQWPPKPTPPGTIPPK